MELFKEIQMGGHGPLHDHAGTSWTCEGYSSGDHHCSYNDTNSTLPNADNCRSLPACTGVRSHHPNKQDASLVARDSVIHDPHLFREHDTACQPVAASESICKPPPGIHHAKRSQVNISANALIIIAYALGLTYRNSDASTYAEAKDSPHRGHWKCTME